MSELKRFYVSMTWEDWPEGGSYDTVVQALGPNDAQITCLAEMKDLRGDDSNADPDNWHVVNCFDLDEFIANNMQP